MARPRPRVEGRNNPGAIGKGESPVGNSSRSVPKPLTSTRAEAASQLLKKYGKRTNIPKRTGSFTTQFVCDEGGGHNVEVDSD